jgi:hypothetical protein
MAISERLRPKQPQPTKSAVAWSKTYAIPAVLAGAFYIVPIAENDLLRYGPFQKAILDNRSNEDFRVYLDGQIHDKDHIIRSKSSKDIGGRPFSLVLLENLDASNANSVNEVFVVVAQW